MRKRRSYLTYTNALAVISKDSNFSYTASKIVGMSGATSGLAAARAFASPSLRSKNADRYAIREGRSDKEEGGICCIVRVKIRTVLNLWLFQGEE